MANRSPGQPSVASDMVHSEDEIRHALGHLMTRNGEENLEGHECMVLYRNVRSKYVDYEVKDGPRQFRSFRSINGGILAAYQSGTCFRDERPASALYVVINPRHVPDALKETHGHYCQWLEHQVGISQKQVKRGNHDDFPGTLHKAFGAQVAKCNSRKLFSMIDVDDNDPDTWLAVVLQAIGEQAVEMVIETKNGFHVVYQRQRMTQEAHDKLRDVLRSDTGKGKDAKVTDMNGCSLSCALPGGYQADHKIRIRTCSCRCESS